MKHGYMLNPDEEFVRNLRKRIKANSGYCPCRMTKSPDTKCPCVDFVTNGECHCGLYIKDPCAELDEEKNEGWV